MDMRSLRTSAQQLDPLSWFAGRGVALVLAGVLLVYGLLRIPTWFETQVPWLQPIAGLLCIGGCVYVFAMTRPLRPQLGWRVGIVAVSLGVIAVVLSAVGYAGTDQSLELWWAPFGLSLVIISLSPYLSTRPMIVLGASATILATVLSSWVLRNTDSGWGPIATCIIIAAPMVAGLVASVTFATVLVGRMLPIIDQLSVTAIPQGPVDAAAEESERVRLGQLTGRAVPFLAGIAATGTVTAADRVLAGQLARRLRDELVTRSNLSWLDSVADNTRLVVIDPDRRAGLMSPSQRTALRALLLAVLDTPGADSSSLLIELRGRPDGATAVALSMDLDLPEGRRIMHVAPYYITLGTAVDELRWNAQTLSFTVPRN